MTEIATRVNPHAQLSHFLAMRGKIVGVVRSPLGFFTLSLLIVEGFLLGAGVFFNLSPTIRGIAIGVGETSGRDLQSRRLR